MRLVYALLTALIASADAVSIDMDSNRAKSSQISSRNDPPEHSSLGADDRSKRFLRSTDTNDDVDDSSGERMFGTAINGVLGKVGSVVETGGTKVAKVAKELPKLEKYQTWLNAGLTPSQVRVDVLKKEPWQHLRSILRGKNSYQYLKFIVDYQRKQPGSKIPKPASQMEKYELWLYAGLTPSQVRVDILKKAPHMKREVLWGHKDLYQYAKFAGEYKRLNPKAIVAGLDNLS